MPEEHLDDQALSDSLNARRGQLYALNRSTEHLAQCPQCQARLAQMRATVELLREYGPVAPPRRFTLPDNLIQASRPRWPGYLAIASMAASLVLFFSVVGTLNAGRQQTFAPGTARAVAPAQQSDTTVAAAAPTTALASAAPRTVPAAAPALLATAAPVAGAPTTPPQTAAQAPQAAAAAPAAPAAAANAGQAPAGAKAVAQASVQSTPALPASTPVPSITATTANDAQNAAATSQAIVGEAATAAEQARTASTAANKASTATQAAGVGVVTQAPPVQQAAGQNATQQRLAPWQYAALALSLLFLVLGALSFWQWRGRRPPARGPIT